MPWKVNEVMDERIAFVVRALGAGANLSEVCRQFGISRPTGYKWLRRYEEGGSFSALKEHSRRPHTSPGRTPAQQEERVVQLRRRYGWGARKLKVLLQREGREMAERTINRILKRQGLVEAEAGSGPALKRFERAAPNELWQMDFKGEYPAPGGSCYPLSILDDHSRYVVGLYGLRGTGYQGVHESLVRTFEAYGLPQSMLLDHGVPWWSNTNGYGLTRLSVELIEQGIDLRWSGVGHPQTQGQVERFHWTLEQALRHQGAPRHWGGWSEWLERIREEYNQIRPHEALAMEVPAQHYRPSPRCYNPQPPAWEYPLGLKRKRLNSQGALPYGRRRYFVSEALARQVVGLEEVDQRLLVRYRHMYVREINLSTGRTKPLVCSTRIYRSQGAPGAGAATGAR